MRIETASMVMAFFASSAAVSINGLTGDEAVRATLIRREADPEVPSHEAAHIDEHAKTSVQRERHEEHEKIERQAQWAERIERHEARADGIAVSSSSSVTKATDDLAGKVESKTIKFAGMPPSDANPTGDDLGAPRFKIKYSFIDGEVTDADNRWKFTAGAGNAKWLRNIDDKSAIALVGNYNEGGYKYVLSDNYAGCYYRVFGTPTGQVIGAHIYRGGTGDKEQYDNLMLEYARANNWVELHDKLTTNGFAEREITGLATLTQLNGGVVKSLRMGMKGSMGEIAHVSGFTSSKRFNAGTRTWA